MTPVLDLAVGLTTLGYQDPLKFEISSFHAKTISLALPVCNRTSWRATHLKLTLGLPAHEAPGKAGSGASIDFSLLLRLAPAVHHTLTRWIWRKALVIDSRGPSGAFGCDIVV